MDDLFKSRFSTYNTNIIKGVAVLMLLIHHLFYSPSSFNEIHLFSWDGNDFGIWSILAYICKICVPIFLFLSGYGLYKSYNNSILQFYIKRFKKIYLTYWYIWLVFVPYGFIFSKFTLFSLYGEHSILKLIANFLGVHLYFNYFGINPTWWFISLIIGLYILFPLLYKIVNIKNGSIVLLILAYILQFVHLDHIAALNLFSCNFVLGMIIAKYDVLPIVKDIKFKYKDLIILLLIIIFSIFRFCVVHKSETGGCSFVDIFLCYLIIQYVFNLTNTVTSLHKILNSLGVHSFNIFLFHTFIFAIYWPKYVYFTKIPIIIFFVFLIECYVCSVFLQKIKSGFNKICKNI